jgi:hypothetical protein
VVGPHNRFKLKPAVLSHPKKVRFCVRSDRPQERINLPRTHARGTVSAKVGVGCPAASSLSTRVIKT